ncbi:hypothetical protein E2C01_039793 [Portunus trituberculatus]|uniref:Uncharacterized protein n=1 Tax=Portunus trituberculatus TaxID=210409 RepID=A0A5B7FNZ2_PORTR|nr:hypothetical protein [Portunus trituberculatus]
MDSALAMGKTQMSWEHAFKWSLFHYSDFVVHGMDCGRLTLSIKKTAKDFASPKRKEEPDIGEPDKANIIMAFEHNLIALPSYMK